MIHQEKHQQALEALNAILVRARWLAYEANAVELADLLDAAEILPKYMAQPEDATQEYQAAIASISQRFPGCAYIGEAFAGDCALPR